MMASTLAGNDNTPERTDKAEICCVSLALAIKTEDADQFVQIYDTVPADFDRNKVDDIKARARALSEESVEYLQSYRAVLQQDDGLGASLDADGGSQTVGPDINNNLPSGCGPAGAMAYVKNNLNSMVNGKDYSDTRPRKLRPTPACNGPVNSSLSLLGPSSNESNQTGVNKSGANWIQKTPKEVDAKIGFGLLKNNSTGSPKKDLGKQTSLDPGKDCKNCVSPFSCDSLHTDKGPDDVGPCPPEKALRTSLGMIGKPDERDVKNCPPAELISTNHVDEGGVDETTPFLGPQEIREGLRKGPQKRHGEQQREREVEDVYDSPMAYDDKGALNFQPNYGTCDSKDFFSSSVTTMVPGEQTTVRTEGTGQKKKKKKRKKAKQGAVTPEVSVDAEESKKSADELSSQPSSPSFETEVKKVTSKVRPEQNAPTPVKVEVPVKEKPVKREDRTRSSKQVESSGRKKNEAKKKSPAGDAARKEQASEKEAPEKHGAPVEPENRSESEGVSESDDGSFTQWHRRTLGVDPAKVFDGKDAKPECDPRTAMSDPGENEEDSTGWSHVVKHRKSKRREKVSGYNRLPYPSRNFSMDDSSSNTGYGYYSRRGMADPSLENLRKSHSLPKEMCKYGRRRAATTVSDSDEVASTATTTATTPSRRNSLETSDENLLEQKKQQTPSSSSYAGRVKASMAGPGHVQSPKESDRDPPVEGYSSNPGSSKTNYSIQDSKRQNNTIDNKDTKDFHQVESDNPGEANSKSAHSLSEAMNLEISPSKKFEMNFPNLTPSATPVQGSSSQVANTPQQPHNKSVQYLDLEYTKNSYAGRVKRSVNESNKKPATPQPVPSRDGAPGTSVPAPRTDYAARTTEGSFADSERKGGQSIPNILLPQTTKASTVSHNSLQQGATGSVLQPGQPTNLENKAKTEVSFKIINDPDKFRNSRKTVAITSSVAKVSAKPPIEPSVAMERPAFRPPMPSGSITFGDLIIGQDDEILVVDDATKVNNDSCDVVRKNYSLTFRDESGRSGPPVKSRDNDDLAEPGTVPSLDATKPTGREVVGRSERGLYVSELESSILRGMAGGEVQFGPPADDLLEQSHDSNGRRLLEKPTAEGDGESVQENGTHWIKVLTGATIPSMKSPSDVAEGNCETLMVRLMSSKEVTIDISESWERTRRFNHAELSAMLAGDWERTVQQRQRDPSSVEYA